MAFLECSTCGLTIVIDKTAPEWSMRSAVRAAMTAVEEHLARTATFGKDVIE